MYLKNDFTRQVSFNNNIVRILIDNGAKVSVCGIKQAKLWGLPILVKEIALCSVTYKSHTIPIKFFVLLGPCQLIIDGFKVTQLQIITKDKYDTLFNPVKMLKQERELCGEFNF